MGPVGKYMDSDGGLRGFRSVLVSPLEIEGAHLSDGNVQAEDKTEC